jgi:hypothetical protein
MALPGSGAARLCALTALVDLRCRLGQRRVQLAVEKPNEPDESRLFNELVV